MKNTMLLLTFLLIASCALSQTTYPRKILLRGDTLIALNVSNYDSLLSKLLIKDFFIEEATRLEAENDSLLLRISYEKEVSDLWRTEADKNAALSTKLSLANSSLVNTKSEYKRLLAREERKKRFWQTISIGIGAVLFINYL